MTRKIATTGPDLVDHEGLLEPYAWFEAWGLDTFGLQFTLAIKPVPETAAPAGSYQWKKLMTLRALQALDALAAVYDIDSFQVDVEKYLSRGVSVTVTCAQRGTPIP